MSILVTHEQLLLRSYLIRPNLCVAHIPDFHLDEKEKEA